MAAILLIMKGSTDWAKGSSNLMNPLKKRYWPLVLR